MDTIQKVSLNDIERLIEVDFLQATESAALNALRWLGKGDSLEAHAATVDALRGALDITSVSATVMIGDGANAKASSFARGEKLGDWGEDALELSLGIIPIDGAELVSKGLAGALCVLVAGSNPEGQSCFANIPCRRTEKIAYGPAVNAGPAQVHLDASVRDNLEIIAMKLGKRIQDISVAVLDRQRHHELIGKIRKAGASVRLISQGDLATCLAPCFPYTGVDVYMGIGGGAEAVMASTAIKCLGGDILVRMAPSEQELGDGVMDGFSEEALTKRYCADDLTHGDNVLFCATAISDSSFLRGIQVNGNLATTHSVVMRSRFRTIRYIKTDHDLSRKKIRLHSAKAEMNL